MRRRRRSPMRRRERVPRGRAHERLPGRLLTAPDIGPARPAGRAAAGERRCGTSSRHPVRAAYTKRRSSCTPRRNCVSMLPIYRTEPPDPCDPGGRWAPRYRDRSVVVRTAPDGAAPSPSGGPWGSFESATGDTRRPVRPTGVSPVCQSVPELSVARGGRRPVDVTPGSGRRVTASSCALTRVECEHLDSCRVGQRRRPQPARHPPIRARSAYVVRAPPDGVPWLACQ